jgi:hypothetical protein
MRIPRKAAFFPRLALALALASLCAAVWPGRALAEGDDHAKAQALVDGLSHDALHAPVIGELLARARRQLERANGLRATYDETRARAADGAALEWAETARDVVRAVDAEAKAAEVRGKALEAQAQVTRTRALVDENTARIGRLKAELQNADKEAKADPDRHAVELHAGDPEPKKKTAEKKPAKKPAATEKTAAGDTTGGKP